MKNRYLAVLIAFTCISGLVFFGCAEDRNNNGAIDALAGSWEMTSMTVTVDGEGLRFGPTEVSGTMFLGNNGSNWNMTITSIYLDETQMGSGQSWTADGRILSLERISELWSYQYVLDGDILSFTATVQNVSTTYEWERDSPSVLF